MKTIKQLEKEIKSLRKNEDNYKECPKCNIHFGKQLTWRKLEVLQTLKDVLKLIDEWEEDEERGSLENHLRKEIKGKEEK